MENRIAGLNIRNRIRSSNPGEFEIKKPCLPNCQNSPKTTKNRSKLKTIKSLVIFPN
jgi:hypothetical protein